MRNLFSFFFDAVEVLLPLYIIYILLSLYTAHVACAQLYGVM